MELPLKRLSDTPCISVKGGRKLRAFKAKPAKDPMLKAKAAAEEREEDKRPFSEQIRSIIVKILLSWTILQMISIKL